MWHFVQGASLAICLRCCFIACSAVCASGVSCHTLPLLGHLGIFQSSDADADRIDFTGNHCRSDMQKSQLWTMRVKSTTLKSFTQYSATLESLVWAKSEHHLSWKLIAKSWYLQIQVIESALSRHVCPANDWTKSALIESSPCHGHMGKRINVVSLWNTVDIATASANVFFLHPATESQSYQSGVLCFILLVLWNNMTSMLSKDLKGGLETQLQASSCIWGRAPF